MRLDELVLQMTSIERPTILFGNIFILMSFKHVASIDDISKKYYVQTHST